MGLGPGEQNFYYCNVWFPVKYRLVGWNEYYKKMVTNGLEKNRSVTLK